jgi:pimeloyl-ACP methyl ester carboxylesterase
MASTMTASGMGSLLDGGGITPEYGAPMPEDVVLLHGFTGSSRSWDRVIEHLPEALAPHPVALAGHHGGPSLHGAAPTLGRLAEHAAAELDAAGLRQPHLVGNSLGAWLALELAARGRASSVLGFGPAGFWRGPGDPTQAVRRRLFARQIWSARLARPLLPALYALAPVRRFALRDMAVRGERVSRKDLLHNTDGALGCSAYPRLLDATGDGARLYDDIPCPVRLLLLEHDRLFPPDPYLGQVRERVPRAEVEVLPGVGHVPMFDDPALVAAEIARWIARSGTPAD